MKKTAEALREEAAELYRSVYDYKAAGDNERARHAGWQAERLEKEAATMTHTATAKRNALNATTKKEQAIAARIAALPQDSDEAQELLDAVTNIWVIDLADMLAQEAHDAQSHTDEGTDYTAEIIYFPTDEAPGIVKSGTVRGIDRYTTFTEAEADAQTYVNTHERTKVFIYSWPYGQRTFAAVITREETPEPAFTDITVTPEQVQAINNRIAAGREYAEHFGDINEDRNEPTAQEQATMTTTDTERLQDHAANAKRMYETAKNTYKNLLATAGDTAPWITDEMRMQALQNAQQALIDADDLHKISIVLSNLATRS